MRLVDPLELGGDPLAGDRAADVRHEQHADVLRVVAGPAPVHVEEVHPLELGVEHDVVRVEVAVDAHGHRRRQALLDLGGALEQPRERGMADPEHAGLGGPQRLEVRVHGEQLGQAIGDLPHVVHPGRLGARGGRPDVPDRLEEAPRRAHLVVPGPRQVHVAEERRRRGTGRGTTRARPPGTGRASGGTSPGARRFHSSIARTSSSILRSAPSFQITAPWSPIESRAMREPLMPPQICRKSRPVSAVSANGPTSSSRCRYWCSLSRSPVRMKSVVSRDVQDGVADPLEELGDEEVRDHVGRVVTAAGEQPERLLERLAVLAVQLDLAAAGVLGLLGAGVREGRDHLVERGQAPPAPRWPGRTAAGGARAARGAAPARPR